MIRAATTPHTLYNFNAANTVLHHGQIWNNAVPKGASRGSRMLLRLLLLIVSFAGYANAEDVLGGTWQHNRSTVELKQEGANLEISYLVARRGLPVTRGTKLFVGSIAGSRLTGTAYVFSAVCGSKGYAVSGDVSEGKLKITLKGDAPTLGANCEQIGSKSDTLLFARQVAARMYAIPQAPTIARKCRTSAGLCNLPAPAAPSTRCWCPVPGGSLPGNAE
jgi:hypothetical protein